MLLMNWLKPVLQPIKDEKISSAKHQEGNAEWDVPHCQAHYASGVCTELTVAQNPVGISTKSRGTQGKESLPWLGTSTPS